jgi:hypothetical protein
MNISIREKPGWNWASERRQPGSRARHPKWWAAVRTNQRASYTNATSTFVSVVTPSERCKKAGIRWLKEHEPEDLRPSTLVVRAAHGSVLRAESTYNLSQAQRCFEKAMF